MKFSEIKDLTVNELIKKRATLSKDLFEDKTNNKKKALKKTEKGY